METDTTIRELKAIENMSTAAIDSYIKNWHTNWHTLDTIGKIGIAISLDAGCNKRGYGHI